MAHGGTPGLVVDVAGGAVQKTKVYFSYYRFCALIDRTRPEANRRFYEALKKAIPEIRVKQRELVFPPLAVARDCLPRSGESLPWISMQVAKPQRAGCRAKSPH